ncbi:hypothetical protein SAY87_027919 [Trapa incisa]|uniref:Fatty acyl-CoA reductase C-terminal domain-containing protein n=1 Tax=Trapa incisa TaxID=236973 RepID=A0AAN7KZN9_9MYRT|nr:hypothetical protein SAY87_027919 [Trapa incisa]
MERLQADPSRMAVMEGGSLVLAPNGRTQNMSLKEKMVPYGGNQGHSLVEMDDGFGIIRFLRGKRLFITGATGKVKYYDPKHELMDYYMARFDTNNTQRLMERMLEEERRTFGFDVQSIDWKDYITNVHIPGLGRHVIKGRRSTM